MMARLSAAFGGWRAGVCHPPEIDGALRAVGEECVRETLQAAVLADASCVELVCVYDREGRPVADGPLVALVVVAEDRRAS